jgi:hypothetical protein
MEFLDMDQDTEVAMDIEIAASGAAAAEVIEDDHQEGDAESVKRKKLKSRPTHPGPACNEKCKKKCSEVISEERRQFLMNAYWDMPETDKRNLIF